MNSYFLKFICFIILSGCLCGCATINTKSINCSYADSSFWFSLDPKILTKNTGNRVTSLTTNNKKFDSIFLKSQILISTFEQAQNIYRRNQIANEISMTIAMIDSIDPISTFSGPSISIADEAYRALLKQRERLVLNLTILNNQRSQK